MLASIPPPPITSLHLGPVRVTVFGLAVAIAVLMGVSVTRRRYERAGGDPGLVDRVLFPAILVGFVGARLAYVATNTGRFQGRWLEVFAVWQGGLALFGGLTFGTLTAIWLIRRFQGDLGAFAGAAAIGVPLAQAIGRPADYFSQELYGTPSTLPWAVQVPERFRPAAYADAATFHPAFFYEALWSLATVGVLLCSKVAACCGADSCSSATSSPTAWVASRWSCCGPTPPSACWACPATAGSPSC
jgi:prolipoprotein diacylglyceryl transferase